MAPWLPGPSQLKEAERKNPEYFHRNIGLLVLFCALVILLFLILTWVTGIQKRNRPQTAWDSILTSPSQEEVPMLRSRSYQG